MSNHARRRRHPVTKVVGASGTILTLGAALVAATPGTAGAASIQVTSALDDDGAGTTLREAIVQANGTAAEDDIITFAPALNGQTITLTQGVLDISDALNIQGPGSALLTVDADDSSQVFEIANDAGNVTIAGLTLTGGSTGGDGGAIESDTTGSLTLTNLLVSESYAEVNGGGVDVAGASSLTVTGTTFAYNYADSDGGGLHVYNVDGAVNITTTAFDQNYASDYGGGLSLYRVDGATTITGNFTDNEATIGGGISLHQVDGTTSIVANITGSEEASYGGGISIYDTSGAVTITTSTIANNSVDEFGGGVRARNTGDVTISRSTISGNYASVDGGGIYAYDTGTFTVTNSTISGNEAGRDGGGLEWSYAEGGGELVISHSTITRNDADAEGGGLYLGGDATIDHTIIADNPTGGDVGGDDDSAADLSNSLIGDADLGDVTVNDGGNNEFNADAMLGALAGNGGTTMTHALLAGSPAVLDSGDPAFTAPPSTDQRGEARVSNEVIDKGAYEHQVDEPPATGPGGAVPVPGDPSFTG